MDSVIMKRRSYISFGPRLCLELPGLCVFGRCGASASARAGDFYVYVLGKLGLGYQHLLRIRAFRRALLTGGYDENVFCLADFLHFNGCVGRVLFHLFAEQ
jgi:hypothetical protein